jgi:hypothetical protein
MLVAASETSTKCDSIIALTRGVQLAVAIRVAIA